VQLHVLCSSKETARGMGEGQRGSVKERSHMYSVCFLFCTFVDALAKLRNATVNFVRSVRPSVCQHGTTRLPLDAF
jgi:hypothetical protein